MPHNNGSATLSNRGERRFGGRASDTASALNLEHELRTGASRSATPSPQNMGHLLADGESVLESRAEGAYATFVSGLVGSSVREALAEHLAASGLPPDAGDSDLFAVVRILYLPYPIPNTRSRSRAVRIHDLHHLVSGYKTDRIGELEISALERPAAGAGTTESPGCSTWQGCSGA